MKSNKKILKITVHLSPAAVDEMEMKDKNVIVVDVLRASTTIAAALKNGAKEIIPVSSVENAVKISGSLFGDVTLRAGERNAKMIEGFNLGNSPRECTKEVVQGKSIIFMTTNGSVAILRGRHAKNLAIAGFVNISAVVEFLSNLKEDFTIICAGKENNFCIEDTVCAGRIIKKLMRSIDEDVVLDDTGNMSLILDTYYGKQIGKMLKSCDHGRYLTDIGFGEDIKLCGTIDAIDVLPLFTGNVIKLSKAYIGNG
jgi:2-phosphosulfolactate phosphatase